jgi:hypothetical protein
MNWGYGCLITLEGVRQRAQRRFPLQYLHGDLSVLCLFGGVTEGRTDLVHLLEREICDVEVVDDSPDRLRLLTEIFPSYWRYTAAPPLEVFSSRLKAGQAFDMTVADGSRGTIDYTWEDLLPHLLAVTSGYALLRISGAFLSEYDLAPTRGDVARLVASLHGIEIEVIDLVRRSSGDQGTYWAVLRGTHTRRGEETAHPSRARKRAATFADIASHKERCILMVERLGAPNCARLRECTEKVNSIRRSIYDHQRTAVYRCFTSERFMAMPKKRIDAWRHAAAILDLDRFSSVDELWEQARLVTKKRGTITRKARRAERNGYSVKQFCLATYVPDIHDVNHSLEFRGGKPMRSPYRQSIAEMGGYPDRYREPEPPLCPEHNQTYWGVFKSEPGREIGSVRTDDRLVGYIYLLRCGNLARYSRILGHGAHLSQGIMSLLHFHLVQYLLENRPPGLRYLQYTGIFSRGEESGLHVWKRHHLFEPKYIIYDDAGSWTGPGGMSYFQLSDADPLDASSYVTWGQQ